MIPIVTERAALDINQLFEFHGEQAAQQISSEIVRGIENLELFPLLDVLEMN